MLAKMQTYDIIMLVVLAATTIFGAIKGFAWQVASIGSIVVSYFVAYAFRNDVAKMINADPPWNVFLAMLLLYFGCSFVIWMAFRLVSTSIDKVRLREFDRHLGAGFGFIKGMVLCLLITMFAMSLLGRAQQERIANSKSGLYISRVLANSGGLLPTEIKQVVGPYIENIEQRLQEHQTPGGGEGGAIYGHPVSGGAGEGSWGFGYGQQQQPTSPEPTGSDGGLGAWFVPNNPTPNNPPPPANYPSGNPGQNPQTLPPWGNTGGSVYPNQPTSPYLH